MTEPKKKVVVIGAGVAGLAAASKLVKSGLFDVTVLEGDKRIGGRVHTINFGSGIIEGGAQWIHGAKFNSIFEMVKDMDVVDPNAQMAKFSSKAIYVTNTGQLLSEESKQNVSGIFAKLRDGPDEDDEEDDQANTDELDFKQSVGTWACESFWKTHAARKIHENPKICHAILDWIHRFQNNVDGSDNWFQPSIRGQNEYHSCEGNPTIPWVYPFSYATLLHLLIDNEPNKETLQSLQFNLPSWILTEKDVTEVKYSTDTSLNQVTVICKDGLSLIADHLICTVSLGVLRDRPTLFSPPLSSEKQKAINYLGYGSVNKIHLYYDKPWWSEDILGFNFLWEDSETENKYTDPDIDDNYLQKEIEPGIPEWCRSILGFYSVNHNSNCLVSWLTGPPAKYVETLEPSVIKTICTTLIKKFLGTSYDIPEPVDILRSNWYSNPFTRGSYSYRSVDSEVKDAWSSQLATPILSQDRRPIVCFAGEATHPHYYSTVHGAHDSGIREATRLIKYYK